MVMLFTCKSSGMGCFRPFLRSDTMPMIEYEWRASPEVVQVPLDVWEEGFLQGVHVLPVELLWYQLCPPSV